RGPDERDQSGEGLDASRIGPGVATASEEHDGERHRGGNDECEADHARLDQDPEPVALGMRYHVRSAQRTKSREGHSERSETATDDARLAPPHGHRIRPDPT